MQNRKIKQKMKILTILFFLYLFLPLNIQNNNRNTNNTTTNDFSPTEISEKDDLSISPRNQEEEIPIIDPISIERHNVSQFNVSESIISQAPFNETQKTLLDIDNQNMTLDVPTGWDFDQEFVNISALYKDWELIEDGNVTEPVETTPWGFSSNYQKEWDPSVFGFTGELDSETLVIEGDGEPTAPHVPYEAYAEMYQLVNKPDPNLEIWETEFISQGREEYPIFQEFEGDPAWQKNYNNPYGGNTRTATVDLHWNVGNLEAYIKAGTSLFTLGNPSIAWETTFGWDTTFIPKKVELIVGWSVENLGYEANDNFSVICRIDHNYVDGTVDSFGTKYDNATATTIENDYNNGNEGECGSHDVIYRYFDVTDILNPSITLHTLDFGIFMSNINETDDEVRVLFDFIAIRAIEEDQYKIGEFGFHCAVDDFKKQADLEYWLLFSYFWTAEEEIFYPIVFLNDTFTNDTIDPIYIQFDITSRFKNILNSNETDGIGVGIGIVNLNPYKTYRDTFQIILDNITLKPIYTPQNLSVAELQRWNGTTWIDQETFQINTKEPFDVDGNNFTLAFRVNNSETNPYNESTLEFESLMHISRLRENNAEASYFINNIGENPVDTIYWNVTFDNTNTFDQFRDEPNLNFNPIGYNFTIIDLPAFDGLGHNSIDWRLTDGWDPLGRNQPDYASEIRTNGTENTGSKQNVTIVDATKEYPEGLINGTWVLAFTSPNYLNNISINQDIGSSTKFYKTNATHIYVNQTSEWDIEGKGHYNVSVRNASGDWLNSFPKYFPNENNNLSMPWAVDDTEGVGDYQLLGLWNDTNSTTNQTLRAGVYVSTFEVWRRSTATLLIEPPPLASGDIGSFYFNFSQADDGLSISNAANYISLNVNSTNSTWGTDWPPYQYLVDYVEENSTINSEGNYTLQFRTRNVPSENFNVYIWIRKPYFDYQQLFSWVNLTGFPMDLNISYGAIKTSQYSAYMNLNNLPYVNDSSRSIIQVNITNHTNHAPLENGIVSGKFNGSDNVFYSVEIYRETQNVADKGLYNITIDATGLSSTIYDEINNYTLTITASVDGYNSTFIEITTEILPILTEIEAENIMQQYEGGSFDFYASYKNILDPNSPILLNQANLTWYLINDTAPSPIILTGNFSLILNVIYMTTIELETNETYVKPGDYKFQVNASQYNCENATWTQSVIEILPKNTTIITLTVNEEIRIGSSLDIHCKLTYIDNSSIADADLFITITYAGTDIFNIVETTDSNGIATFSQIVPFNYAEEYIEIIVIYNGNSTVMNCSETFGPVIIEGKFEVDLNLSYTTELRVGYTSEILGLINISGVEQYSGLYLTLISWYDGNHQNPIFIQQLAVNQNGSLSYVIPEIEDGHENITFFMDYAGTSTVSYASVEKTINLLPKWTINLLLDDLTGILRIGQEINFNISANFLNSSCNESFYGLPFDITYNYENGQEIDDQFFNINASRLVTYVIPQDCGSWLNISISFDGTNRIDNYQIFENYIILEKWGLGLTLQDIPDEIRQGQVIVFNINGSLIETECNEPLGGIHVCLTLIRGESETLFNGTLNENGNWNVSYTVPVNGASEIEMEVLISSEGTNLILNFAESQNITVLPQMTTYLTILSNIFQQKFTGEFTFSVNLTDENNQGIKGMNILFIVRDSESNIIKNYTAVTNIEGIAEKTIQFEDTGEFTVEPVFISTGVYAGIRTSDDEIYCAVRVVNYGILVIDNIQSILIALGIATVVVTTYYRGYVVPKRKKQHQALLDIHRRFGDIENMQYILIIHKETSTSIFSQTFTEMPIDSTLISGFLSAISTFGKEIGRKVKETEHFKFSSDNDKKSGLEELSYQQFKIAVIEGYYVRAAVLLLKSPSPSLKIKIRHFNAEFERIYLDTLDHFSGKIPAPEPILELIEKILFADLLYPHNIIPSKTQQYLKSTRKKSTSALILKEAEKSFDNTFRLRDMIVSMAGYGRKEVDTFNSIEKLRNEKIIFAVNPRTQYLIEQFKPMIDPLTSEERKVLKEIFNSRIIDEKRLQKITKIAVIIPVITSLRTKEMINDDNSLTEVGEVISTLLNLIPDL